MTIRNVLFACTALFAVPACGGGDDAKVEKMVEIFEEIATAAKSGGDDCGKVAAAVEPVVDKRASELAELKKWGESIKDDKEKSKKLMEKHGERLMKASMSVAEATMKCGQDEKFAAVGKKLDGVM